MPSSSIVMPELYKVRQHFDRAQVKDLDSGIAAAVSQAVGGCTLPIGATIAVTAGSRGIRSIDRMLQLIVRKLRDIGYEPFLVAAMGSHGSGEEAGQRAVLDSLNITAERIGAPVSCSGDVVRIGETEAGDPELLDRGIVPIGGLPVYMAKEAAEADGILIVNRIKPHTSFSGDYESGLLKMLAVGLGRAAGATSVHSLGAEQIAAAIPSIASVMLRKAPVIGGIAIIENAYDETAVIQGIPKDELFREEKRLLLKAKAMMPSLPIQEADLCLVGEMGKNYSGTGMDTNIIGRLRIQGMPEPAGPRLAYLAALGLSEASHGNATGIGLADFTTVRVTEQIDRDATYLNCLTSGFVVRASIPMTFGSDRELIRQALFALKLEPQRVRLIYIKNTLQLDEVWVSAPLKEQLAQSPQCSLEEGPLQLPFDEQGALQLPKH
jgi:hypothetical protein